MIYALEYIMTSSPLQWCIIRLTCSHPELTNDHVLTSAYVEILATFATKMREPEHGSPITRAQFSENQSTPK